MVAIETRTDQALAYVLHLARHLPKGNVSAATLTLLIELGFATHFDGFYYLRYAILMKTKYPDMRVVEIYSEIADHYASGTGYASVERTIRSAIEAAYKQRSAEVWSYFFWDIHMGKKSGCPTAGTFICQMACVIELWCSCCEEVCVDA